MAVGFFVIKLPQLQPAITGFCQLIAELIALLCNTVDGLVAVQGNVLKREGGLAGVQVSKVCSGLEYLITLCALVAASTLPWRQRLILLLWGALFAQLVNLIRITSLLYTASFTRHETFEFVHIHLWPFLFITALLGFMAIYIAPATIRGWLPPPQKEVA